MRRSTSSRSIVTLAVVIALVAVLAILATGAAGRSPAPSDQPSASPSVPVSPSSSPSDPGSPSPTPEPSDAAGIPLDIATPHDVSVVIDDQTGSVVKAASGDAGDGMSVRWFDVLVENIDNDSLRVTWVGLPQDDVVRLTVSENDGAVRLRFVQASPPENSDALGGDRVLVIDFDQAVDAKTVQATIQHGTDTQD